MKKTLLTLGVVALSTLSFAQGAYVSIGTGYANSSNRELIGTTTTSDGISGKSTDDGIYKSYGQGVPLSIRGGYMLNENVGIELGINYLLGSNITKEDISTENFSKVSGATFTDLTTVRSTQFRVMPALVLTTNGEKMSVYTRAGLIVPVGGKTTFEKTVTVKGMDAVAPGTDGVTSIEGESAGSFSVGVFGALGINYNLSEKMQFFVEVESVKLRVKQNTKTLTKYDSKGTDVLATLPKSSVETEYVTSISNTDNQDATQPTKEVRNTGNYNSLGLNIGIKFNL